MMRALKLAVKHAFLPLIYRRPESTLEPAHLYVYLDCLLSTRAVAGAAVEIGCFEGGTAAIAHRFLRSIGCPRRYVCVDTFRGFVQSQFAGDVELGTRRRLRSAFSGNSKALVLRLLDHWGCSDVELIEADVAKLPASALPEAVAVALIDVDLAAPITAAIALLAPKMSPGGLMLIDDCDSDEYRGAKVAAERAAQAVEYRHGMGIIRF